MKISACHLPDSIQDWPASQAVIRLPLIVIHDKIFSMIQSFKCGDTKALYETGKSKRFVAIKKVAERKLQMLDAAVTLDFLKSPPGNHLEALVGDLAGRHSIRINIQWRVCFVWTALGPMDVEIIDYH